MSICEHYDNMSKHCPQCELFLYLSNHEGNSKVNSGQFILVRCQGYDSRLNHYCHHHHHHRLHLMKFITTNINITTIIVAFITTITILFSPLLSSLPPPSALHYFSSTALTSFPPPSPSPSAELCFSAQKSSYPK